MVITGPERRFCDALTHWILPGAVYTFVGAGGKTTAMKRIASFLVDAGLKVRLTTTTRVGIEELKGVPVFFVRQPTDLPTAIAGDFPLGMLVGSALHDTDKYQGIAPRLIESLALDGGTVLLVEGDGSRRCPVKIPKEHEPVIPANTRTVFAVMGALAIDEPIDEIHCYNHEKALLLARRSGGILDVEMLAAISGDPQGSAKGVLSGMGFHLLINQGDVERKRPLAMAVMRRAHELYGVSGAVVSMQKGELYARTDD